MPCRKENYIFLERSVTVGPKDVDALVTRIGEALQLHSNPGSHQRSGAGGATATGFRRAVVGAGGAGGGCCMRLRNNQHHRPGPYSLPGPSGDHDWDHIKQWNKRRLASVEEDDPHRLLQELILSGNLIKEAVRRLQFAAEGGAVPS